MTLTQAGTGRRRRILVPVAAESVPPPPPPERPAHLQDPPIYRALIGHWADRGKAVPGRPDPEWARLVAPPGSGGRFSGFPDRRGAGR
ncbi:hypothetical protein EOT10_14485 [Streptomyces antnestii]|uniref:Uncharacterized protein n=1 Tax=Streptomyces antnestii TaxID=2494256 RepID=A0A3S3UHA8_9ACTN|nr:hypothetical protein [Streptomyces sp. San01]RVU25447.1 hypothetical protein EOT10_14485 [Streptomyces sp. San01]